MVAPLNSELLRHRYTLPANVILLNGHVSQAPPNAAMAGIVAAHHDWVKHPGERCLDITAAAGAVRTAVTERLSGGDPDDIVLGENEDALLALFLQNLPQDRSSILMQDGGFRNVTRLCNRRVGINVLNEGPVEDLVERLLGQMHPGIGGVLVSQVLERTGELVPHLEKLVEAADKQGTAVLIEVNDFNVIPFNARDHHAAFLLGSGERHAQWGDGVGWMRLPYQLRQFSFEYERMLHRGAPFKYDPTAHYRARAVAQEFAELGLDVPTLRANSLRQTDVLLSGLDGYKLLTPREAERRGSFLVIELADAERICGHLRTHDIWVDALGRRLRFGPAPYTTDEDIERALTIFRKLVPLP
ncbi:hypothetical protein KBD34_03555 [Patescibacteria group bacterium]|nr:hypothetical protein [Patescibacteria group bacterium]